MIEVGPTGRCIQNRISVRAANSGGAPATITVMCLRFYPSLAVCMVRKPSKSFWVSQPGTPRPLPFLVDPRAIWDGRAMLDEEAEPFANEGRSFAELYQAGGRPSHVPICM